MQYNFNRGMRHNLTFCQIMFKIIIISHIFKQYRLVECHISVACNNINCTISYTRYYQDRRDNYNIYIYTT